MISNYIIIIYIFINYKIFSNWTIFARKLSLTIEHKKNYKIVKKKILLN